MKRLYVNIGETFGRLTILGEEVTHDNKRGVRCICLCGNTTVTRISRLVSGQTKSCGCILKEFNKNTKKGKPNYKGRRGTKDISKDYWNIVIRNAKNRKIKFSITIEQAQQILENQNYKCALTGVDLKCGYVKKENRVKDHTISLDRINPNEGYSIENIQWVHKDVNWIKADYSEEYLFSLCEKILRFKKPELFS